MPATLVLRACDVLVFSFPVFCVSQNFAKYVEVVRKNVTRGLSLGLLFTHIAEKEGLKVREE